MMAPIVLLASAYRVVRQSEFYYSMEYTKCRKRNGYTVSYQKLNGHKDCFGHIQFFVLVQPSMCVLDTASCDRLGL